MQFTQNLQHSYVGLRLDSCDMENETNSKWCGKPNATNPDAYGFWNTQVVFEIPKVVRLGKWGNGFLLDLWRQSNSVHSIQSNVAIQTQTPFQTINDPSMD